jgi:hypothetical protein
MRIDTRRGPIETRRHLARSPHADMVIIDETFRLPGSNQESVVRVNVQRQLYTDNPAVADPQLRQAIERMVVEREAQEAPQFNLVDRPGMRPTLREHALGALATDPRPIDFYTEDRLARMNTPTYGGYIPDAANVRIPPVTWNRTNAVALAPGEVVFWNADTTQEAQVDPVKKPAERDLTCSCGHPDDPNWQHEHDECTFLDRPSSEWYDEGEA